MAFIERDGGQVYYEHYNGQKIPIFLIHGWGMSTGIWSSVIDRLVEAGHEVVALDHRGCGRSDRDFDDMSVEAIAGDVAAIGDKLYLRPCVLDGWSMGGTVAVEAARLMGDRAAGLFLTCAASPRISRAPDFPYGGEPGAYDGLGEGINADRGGFFRGLAASVCAKDIGQANLDWMERVFVDSSPRAWKALSGVGNMDQRATLAALDIPVLSCVGDKDQVISPDIGIQAAKSARNGETVHFEESGHAPFLEEPEKYMGTLRRFAESVG